MYLITVICPTYNCEKYIQRTINSIINQTIGFENIELIFVDDCSTDSTKNIIAEYSKEYKNIVPFFLKENHGFPGFGRNVGLEKSTTEFVMFMDNDDELDEDTGYSFVPEKEIDNIPINWFKATEWTLREMRENINLKIVNFHASDAYRQSVLDRQWEL